jgi:phosphate transport system permease protein
MAMTAYETFTRSKSRVMLGLCVLFTAVIIGVLGLVTGYLVSIGYKSIDLEFFTKDPVPMGAEGFPGGMRNGIVGTLILIGLASLVGIPVGMLTGVYLAEYGGRSQMGNYVRFIADVLTGWAGALALAFIMIPLVARTTEEMLLLVPRSYREASVALGATKARTILKVVLPAATGSVITGIMLAIARVAGETAPLLFTALGVRFLELNPNRAFPSLTVEIYNNAANSPSPEEHRRAWAGILVLLLLIFALNLVVRMTARALTARK